MVPYKETLSDEHIRALIVFMREKEGEMRDFLKAESRRSG